MLEDIRAFHQLITSTVSLAEAYLSDPPEWYEIDEATASEYQTQIEKAHSVTAIAAILDWAETYSCHRKVESPRHHLNREIM